MHSHRKRRGFTLVELLVVIAILGVLAALLLPALASSRASARTATCTSQLRQFGIAAQLYWDDHQGEAFRYRGPAARDGDLYWFGWIQRGAEGTRLFDPSQGALWSYLPEKRIQSCPALPIHSQSYKPKASSAAGGYGYNLALSARDDAPAVRLTACSRPADLAVFADSAQINDFQPPASRDNPLIEPFFYVNTTEPTAHFRHAQRAAAVFADGHVSRERALPGSLDHRLPKAQIGRLRPEILVIP